LKPGDFPLGSLESRAAARMLVHQRGEQCDRLEIIVFGEPADDGAPLATPWMKDQNGSELLIRILGVPQGMTVEEARRMVDSNSRRD